MPLQSDEFMGFAALAHPQGSYKQGGEDFPVCLILLLCVVLVRKTLHPYYCTSFDSTVVRNKRKDIRHDHSRPRKDGNDASISGLDSVAG